MVAAKPGMRRIAGGDEADRVAAPCFNLHSFALASLRSLFLLKNGFDWAMVVFFGWAPDRSKETCGSILFTFLKNGLEFIFVPRPGVYVSFTRNGRVFSIVILAGTDWAPNSSLLVSCWHRNELAAAFVGLPKRVSSTISWLQSPFPAPSFQELAGSGAIYCIVVGLAEISGGESAASRVAGEVDEASRLAFY